MNSKEKKKREFIIATIQIIEEEGIDNISARKIASKTGFKQGSIYNYFENLKELETLASIKFIKNYIDLFVNDSKKLKNNLEIYLAMWERFLFFSFKKPRIFYNVFYNSYENRNYDIFAIYYDLFPEDLPEAGRLEEMLLLDNSYIRGEYILKKCIKEKSINKDMLEYINYIHLRYTKSIVMDLINKNIENTPRLYNQTLVYLIYSMQMYIGEDYKNEITNFLSFHQVSNNYDFYEF